MAKKQLRVGMIGYGFMGRAHSNAYKQVSHFFDLELPGRSSRPPAPATRPRSRRSPTSGATSRSRPTGGSWSSARTSTSIDICTPNNLHEEIAIAAAARRAR